MRFQADLAADYWARGGSGASGRAQVMDVSRDGMRVAVPHELPRGERLKFSLQVPGDNVPIFGTGEVAWASPAEAVHGAGLRFLQIKPLDLARMLDYLYTRWLGA